MKQVVVNKPGGYARLTVETGPDPVPGPAEVLVRTRAIGVNFADCVVRMGLYESARKYVGFPITPGFECAGDVAAVGEQVRSFAPGDRVIALTRFGAYSTHVVAPAAQVFRLPEALDAAQGATFMVVHLTAWYALCELAHLRPGMRLLVHSAAGGVGSALTQVGKLHDCTVVGVVGSSHKVPAARAVGADHVIDKSTTPLWKEAKRLAPEGYDVVLDANGVETLRGSYRHLAPTGRLIIYGAHSMLRRGGSGRPNYGKLAIDFARTPWFNPLFLTNDNKGVLGFNLSYLFERTDRLTEAMDTLFGWLGESKIRPLSVASYPLDKVSEAHRALETGTTVGKIVLIP